LITFETTREQKEKIPELTSEMLYLGLNPSIVEKLSLIAMYDQGVFDLMELWIDVPGRGRGIGIVVLQKERDEVLKDLLASIKDYGL